MASEAIEFDGHRLAYRVSGTGPALVVLNLYRRRPDLMHAHLCIAQATDRAGGVICGGFAPYPMTPGIMRQLDRRLRPNHPSRSLWWWYKRFDWPDHVNSVSCARLFYWGAEDRRMATKLRCMRGQLSFQEVDFVEFPGFDHGECNTPEALASPVIPAVTNWLSQHLGSTR